jgi:hypothetical protein
LKPLEILALSIQDVDSWREKFEGIKKKWSEMSNKVSFDIEKRGRN